MFDFDEIGTKLKALSLAIYTKTKISILLKNDVILSKKHSKNWRGKKSSKNEKFLKYENNTKFTFPTSIYIQICKVLHETTRALDQVKITMII